MPDAPPPPRTDPAAEPRPVAGSPLTPGRIDAILADFRGWLEDLGGEPGEAGPAEPVGLASLVEQVAALRHEVNLQTRATRAVTEQATAALKRLDAADEGEALRPLVGVLLDVADALAVSLQQVERARAAAGPLAAELATPPRGFWHRLAGRAADEGRRAEAADRLHRLLAGVADGYTLSLRRVERALPPLGVTAIPAVGRPFDPERMEAIELVAAPDRPSGTVVEETRRGYEWNGKLFRFAQVKVAR